MKNSWWNYDVSLSLFKKSESHSFHHCRLCAQMFNNTELPLFLSFLILFTMHNQNLLYPTCQIFHLYITMYLISGVFLYGHSCFASSFKSFENYLHFQDDLKLAMCLFTTQKHEQFCMILRLLMTLPLFTLVPFIKK